MQTWTQWWGDAIEAEILHFFFFILFYLNFTFYISNKLPGDANLCFMDHNTLSIKGFGFYKITIGRQYSNAKKKKSKELNYVFIWYICFLLIFASISIN